MSKRDIESVNKEFKLIVILLLTLGVGLGLIGYSF